MQHEYRQERSTCDLAGQKEENNIWQTYKINMTSVLNKMHLVFHLILFSTKFHLLLVSRHCIF